MRLSNVAAAAVTTLAVAAPAVASAAPARTGEQAVKRAQACLTSHGAKSVLSGVVGNGFVSFGSGQNARFTYTLTKAWPLNLGRATGVKEIDYDRRASAVTRLVVKRCVYGALR